MEEKATISQVGLRYGLIFGLIFIVYGMILQFLDLATNQALGYVNYVILVIGLVLAFRAFMEGGDGYMSLGQGIKIGMLISLVSGALSGIFSYVYIKFVDDSMLEKIKDLQIQKMEEQGMTDDQIDKAVEIAGKFMSAELIPVYAVFGMLIAGFILSLIVVAIMKKNNPTLEV